ncbi:aminotransferase class I/II-fold pyridoxal phosphate-dependent enzyme, partial [Psychroserpens sp.]|uniref:aminotransferase class I/II-fold pyridoxal phosphate-dependent enzyme n=1 Tax=Psychroserpens sp. TaxID=2020870 RepID=UPI003C76ADAA
MKSKIWLSPPHLGTTERLFVQNAFDTNWVAPFGPHIDGFETDIQTYLGQDTKVVALNSGTAAIHLALVLLNVDSDDEVICQSNTFAACANPIVYQGATPIFVDSEKDTWNICTEQLEIAIKDRLSQGKKPKAIIAVHLYGVPYKVDEINKIAQAYNIPIIEDAAEAFGSTYNNNKCGTFGTLGVISFNGNKIITTSGGGALITKDQTLKDKAIYLATQARENTVAYVHKSIGYNYRLSNVLAGIGRGQMQVLDERVNARRYNYNVYKTAFQDIEALEFVAEPTGSKSNRWLSCMLTPSEAIKNKLIVALDHQNIEARPLWKPLHLQP